MSRKRKQTGAGNPLNVESIPWSHQKPATFMVMPGDPAEQHRPARRLPVHRDEQRHPGDEGERATTSMPGNASQ